MITASKLAGFFAAHAIWSVSEGETLIPMLAYTRESDDRTMERFVGDDLAQSVGEAKRKLAAGGLPYATGEVVHVDAGFHMMGMSEDVGGE